MVCKVCGKEIKGFPFASYYRKAGYCEEHGKRFGKYNVVRSRVNKSNGQAHPNTVSGSKKCKGYTKHGKKCNAKAMGGGYCQYHQWQKPEKNKNKEFVSYDEYIRSSEWKSKSLECKHKRFWVCALCGGEAKHAHHNSYKNLGDEKAHELTPLCEKCHEDFHRNHEYNSRKHKWERIQKGVKNDRNTRTSVMA